MPAQGSPRLAEGICCDPWRSHCKLSCVAGSQQRTHGGIEASLQTSGQGGTKDSRTQVHNQPAG